MSIPKQVMAGAANAEAHLQSMRDKANAFVVDQPQEPPAGPPPPPPAKDWEAECKAAQQRWTVADTMLKKLGLDNKELNAKIAELEGKLAYAKAKAEAKAEDPPAPPKPAPDLTKYDPELLEVVEHLAEKRVAAVQREVEESRADRERRQAAEAKAREEDAKKAEFVEFMDEFVPGWRNDDNDPEFAAYLATTDQATGQQAQAAYMDAFQRIDGRAMARVFLHYRQTKAAKPAQPPSPPVVPPVSGRADPGDAPPGKLWTVAEIDEFYNDSAKGRLKQRGWDQKRIDATEKDILAAYSEGRVRR